MMAEPLVRPDVCPVCGNPNVGHRDSEYSLVDYCVATDDAEHPDWGCGWLRVTRVE